MPGTRTSRRSTSSIFNGHLGGFDKKRQKRRAPHRRRRDPASIDKVRHKFLPSAVKFTYNWNMRELTNIFQGMCCRATEVLHQPLQLMRPWCTSAARVFADRLMFSRSTEI